MSEQKPTLQWRNAAARKTSAIKADGSQGHPWIFDYF
jgi:hypothetical protein